MSTVDSNGDALADAERGASEVSDSNGVALADAERTASEVFDSNGVAFAVAERTVSEDQRHVLMCIALLYCSPYIDFRVCVSVFNCLLSSAWASSLLNVKGGISASASESSTSSLSVDCMLTLPLNEFTKKIDVTRGVCRHDIRTNVIGPCLCPIHWRVVLFDSQSMAQRKEVVG